MTTHAPSQRRIFGAGARVELAPICANVGASTLPADARASRLRSLQPKQRDRAFRVERRGA
jgi:hypothetical protein